MRAFIIFFVLSVFIQTAVCGPEQVLIAKANRAYAAGAYTEASESYKKVVDAGWESPELYYNLGNAYFKMNEYAYAILWYERAKRLDPGNEDIDFNLKVANNKIADKIEALPDLFYKRWYNGVVGLFSNDQWAYAAIILFIFSLIFGGIYLMSRIMILRKTGFWLGAGILLASLCCLLFAWSGHVDMQKSNEAILLSPTVIIKSSPDEKSVDLFVLHEGTKVQLKDRIGNWYEIRIANGSVGWVPVTTLEKI